MKQIKEILFILIVVFSVILLIMLGYNFIIWLLNLIEAIYNGVIFLLNVIAFIIVVLIVVFLIL